MNIDTKKIMSEVNSADYPAATYPNSTDELESLMFNSNLRKKLEMPIFNRAGIFNPLINKLIRIFYRLVYKIIEPALLAQEKFNHQVIEIIKKRENK